jgi:RNA ligase (TIGR02306 family)
MSSFVVEVVEIEAIEPHPNADRLEIAYPFGTGGWPVIVGKGTYKPGDRAIYCPVNAVLRDPELENRIFPPESKVRLKNSRVRAIKIRGQISQGLIINPEEVPFLTEEDLVIGADLSAFLKISKYEESEESLPQQMKIGQLKKIKPDLKAFKKYTDIENGKYYPEELLEGEQVVVTQKLHGCLQAETMIYLADGSKRSIKDIVEQKLNIEVLGFDHETNQIRPTKILNHFNNGVTTDWLRVQFSRKKMHGGNVFGTVVCTGNHKFWNPISNCYVQARELQSDDKILISRNDSALDYVQSQILIGKMLGDGSYSHQSRHITFSHCEEQKEYLFSTRKALGSLCDFPIKQLISGYGSNMYRTHTASSYLIEDLFKSWFTSGTKQIPKGLILGPIALAYWYMDDGSLSHSDKQEDRAAFATCGFSEESVNNLLDSLTLNGIKGVKYQADGYWRIRLNRDAAEIFFTIVAPYIHPSMRYKLPIYFQDVPFVHAVTKEGPGIDQLIEQTVFSINPVGKQTLRKINKTKYDLETETHNFIADGVLVHNSSFRVGWFKSEANTFWQKVQKFFGLMPEWTFAWGSRNVQIQVKPGQKHSGMHIESQGVDFDDIYTKMVKQYDLKNRIPKGIAIYGEIIGPGVQKNYSYGCKQGQHELYLYDIMDHNGWLNYYPSDPTPLPDGMIHKTFFEYANYLGMKTVPMLYHGPYYNGLITKYIDVNPLSDEINEGVVVRPEQERYSNRIGRVVLKFISDSYYLKDDLTSEYH